MIRNQDGQIATAQVINATTQAAFAGAVTVYVTRDNGLQTIGSVGSGLATLKGNGYYVYTPTATETDGAVVAFTFIGTGAEPVTREYTTISLAQQAALVSSSVSGATAVQTICEMAARKLNIIMATESLNANDGAVILGWLNAIFDLWNAKRQSIFAVSFDQYTLTIGLSPHTIGPSGTFVVPQRPQTIDGAAFIYTTGSTPVYVPITVRNMNWWAAQSVPGLSTTVQTDVAYNPTWPNGELYFWPVPQGAATIELYTRRVIAQVSMSDIVTFPPGYLMAIVLTLVEHIATDFGRQVPGEVAAAARDARATIYANNDVTPPYTTGDAGMPGYASNPGWTWLTGPRWGPQ